MCDQVVGSGGGTGEDGSETDGESNRPLRPMKSLHSVICETFIWHSDPHFQEHMQKKVKTGEIGGGEKCWQGLVSYYVCKKSW